MFAAKAGTHFFLYISKYICALFFFLPGILSMFAAKAGTQFYIYISKYICALFFFLPGILSMFAAKAGAKHVYAIECSAIFFTAQILKAFSL
jgi:hypothetical protein